MAMMPGICLYAATPVNPLLLLIEHGLMNYVDGDFSCASIMPNPILSVQRTLSTRKQTQMLW